MPKTTRNNEGTGRYQWTPELVEENIKRFHKYKSEGTLGNNGPKMPGNETLFSPDRWKAMLENMAKTAPKAAQKFTDATNMKVGQSTAEASKAKDHEEFVVEDRRKDFKELTLDGAVPPFGSSITDSLPTKGMLKTPTSQPTGPGSLAIGQQEVIDAEKEKAMAAVDARKAAKDKAILDEKIQRKKDKEEADRRRAAQDKIIGAKDKLSDILTSYDAVDKLEKQQAAKEKQALEAKRVAQEENSALELALNEAGLAQMAMEAEADKRDNPMSTLTDKEKGDWEVKTLEDKGTGRKATDLLMKETGLDEGKAKALYGKLKGLCN